ncbi:MAG: family 20 glycosylhydrolase [Clostridia bacterium]|nr:family 20 glycosylhydrolase [Clostridia bacterium]
MIFHPQRLTEGNGTFVLPKTVKAVAHSCLNNPTVREFWKNFSFGTSTVEMTPCNDYRFSLGSTPALPLDGYAYSIHADENGICVAAESAQALRDGFMVLLDRFHAIDTEDGIAAEVSACEIQDRAWTENRMVHFCIFPETELLELHRFVRLCGALNYTHVILEFWGMLQYDCMKELSWSHGFTKEQVAPIIREAQELGMEVIPMFNHWGHASACRMAQGKHVVLDQNPALQTYFSENGWCWDIRKPKVQALLRTIRNELIELCGDGAYFHIGCDEAFGFELTEENMTYLCDFINGIGDELTAHGRRAIIWGDMILYRHADWNPDNRYSCHSPAPDVEPFMLAHLDRKIVIADWQYHAVHAPIETASVFTNAGFDCLLCPWDDGRAQMRAVITTIKEQNLMGIMHTTWHTLTKGMPYVLRAAVGESKLDDGSAAAHGDSGNTAALYRKVMPIHGDYKKAGWSKKQIDCKW